jgi:hypothetical protein
LGLRGEEVTGDWRKLHNEELYDLYCSLNVIRVIKGERGLHVRKCIQNFSQKILKGMDQV